MVYSSKTLAKAYLAATEGKKGEELNNVSKKFLALIRKKGLRKKLPEIVTHLETLRDTEEKID